MTKEEAIEIIKEYLALDKDTNSEYLEAQKVVIEALERTRWISCSERLPKEEKKTYWICTNNGYQCECRWTNVNPFWTDLTTDWHWHIADVPQYNKVVAWMPLPEPYRVESEDKE